ncbi:glycosyltransferase family 2 protein [Sedimentitalea sp. CY04]|uniref:Glycosyltransferase family 2 protein n=2 Tax=Parasedimentitalea denitrificans TaxID=2211118 RepID=A0ABX0WCI9_9RHOB|nr:glycosyltransferase family 2 protein [Sedimentitalea sp. CY04]NIZ62987.1 glycosyltransferase family 2 protein [Sedimentitalea sp. CY04]
MKNEGPFILEWVAHHLCIGFDHFLVYTNDCDDGTVELLDALANAGIVTRIDNPYQLMGQPKPQRGALKHAEGLDLVRNADWVLVSDVDEFVNIHVGDGSLDALVKAVGSAEIISMQWRLFGSSNIDHYEDLPIVKQHSYCAPKFCPRPVQAWGIKSMFRPGPLPAGQFANIGVHRPTGKKTTTPVTWVNGSGKQLPRKFNENGWRLGIGTYGYDLVTLNHYSVRNAESYLVKKDRGRVNHVNRDQGEAYWLRMNFNMSHDLSLQTALPEIERRIAELKTLPNVASCHLHAVKTHKEKIKALMTRDDMIELYREITSPRSKLLSRFLNMLTKEHFADGPRTVPDDLVSKLEQVPYFG